MSTISASTTSTTAYKVTADTTGTLVLQTGATPTTAVTVGTDQSVTFAQAANLPNTFGFKNRIINGAMVIDQRYAGALISPAIAGYVTDRWYYYQSQTSKGTIGQNAGAVTPPVGYTNYLGFTSTSSYSVTATDIFYISQFIEGYNVADLAWGTASAAAVTLSFWVRSSLTGTFGAVVTNSAANRTYPFTYTINSANTWEQKSVTIAGDTTGTWLTTNGRGLCVEFSLGVGSTYSGTAGAWTGTSFISSVTGATSVVGTSGATFYITGVQLEKGSTATSFDYRPYGTELALCQRYAFVTDGSASTAGAVSNAASGQVQQRIVHPVSMRSAPAITVNTAGSWVVSNDYNADYTASTVSVAAYSASTQATRVNLGGFASLPATGTILGGLCASGTGKLIFSSEL